MRLLYAPVLVLVLCGGCDVFESDWSKARQACETYVKGQLKAPSTYKRVKSVHSIKRLSKDQFFESSDMKKMGEVGREAVGLMSAPGVHTVFLQYDAENSFGAPLRSNEVCDFLMTDVNGGKYQEYDLASAADHRATMEALQFTLDHVQNQVGKNSGCCLAEGVDHFSIPTNAPVVKTEID